MTTFQDALAMHEFLTYFLSHMPSTDKWVAFLLVNIVAYVAARNTVLRRERQLEKKVYGQQIEQLKAERNIYIQRQQEQEQLVKEQWAMIQRQANQLDELGRVAESYINPHGINDSVILPTHPGLNQIGVLLPTGYCWPIHYWATLEASLLSNQL